MIMTGSVQGELVDVVACRKEDEEALCAVCSGGLSVAPNYIVFCERCDVAVHQHCYGISDIPPGEHAQPKLVHTHHQFTHLNSHAWEKFSLSLRFEPIFASAATVLQPSGKRHHMSTLSGTILCSLAAESAKWLECTTRECGVRVLCQNKRTLRTRSGKDSHNLLGTATCW